VTTRVALCVSSSPPEIWHDLGCSGKGCGPRPAARDLFEESAPRACQLGLSALCLQWGSVGNIHPRRQRRQPRLARPDFAEKKDNRVRTPALSWIMKRSRLSRDGDWGAVRRVLAAAVVTVAALALEEVVAHLVELFARRAVLTGLAGTALLRLLLLAIGAFGGSSGGGGRGAGRALGALAAAVGVEARVVGAVREAAPVAELTRAVLLEVEALARGRGFDGIAGGVLELARIAVAALARVAERAANFDGGHDQSLSANGDRGTRGEQPSNAGFCVCDKGVHYITS